MNDPETTRRLRAFLDALECRAGISLMQRGHWLRIAAEVMAAPDLPPAAEALRRGLLHAVTRRLPTAGDSTDARLAWLLTLGAPAG